MWILLILNIAYAAMLILFALKFLAARKIVRLSGAELPKVSVVVPFRNEEQRLPALLSSLKAQEYPVEKIEWVLVNDHSEDASGDILAAEDDPRMKIISLPQEENGKKQALTAGIRQAAGDWIITTDADCTHATDWVKTIIGTAVQNDAVMICGLVKIQPCESVLPSFQAMETAVLQVSGAGSLWMGLPLLNTGASLCFRKDAWQALGGYSGHAHIASGDDTFQLLRFFERYRERVMPLVHAAGAPATEPALRFSEILAQRIRWNGKVKHYPLSSIHLTGLLVMAAALTWLVSLLMAVFNETGWIWPLSILLVRLIGESTVLAVWFRVIGQSFSPVRILLMAVFYPFFTMFSFIIRPFMKIEWKGRRM